MILNDSEWQFYVKFSLLRTDFDSIIGWLPEYYLLNLLQSVYIRVTRRDMGSGVADRDPQNIWNPRKNCGSFVADTSSES